MKSNRRRRRLQVGTSDTPLVSSAGGALLVEAARASRLTAAMSARLRPWRRPRCNVRYVLHHMIQETARHAGHADIIRETLDGSRGI